jgi:outer membrane lipoprotein carrier protein
MGRFLMWSAAVLCGATVVGGQTSPTADELAGRIQARYDAVRDFSADFTLSYQGAFLKPLPVERGKVSVKKPGRFLWLYETNQKQRFWSDGVRAYSYYPASRQGQSAPLPADDDSAASVLFLLGRGNLVRDFTASLPADQPAGEFRLLLTPRRPQADFAQLTLIVERATLRLRGMLKVDEQGGTTTFQFSNLRENVGLSDRIFAFTFPKGTDIR